MMYQIIFILSAFIFNVQGCEILDEISDGSDTGYWQYLINATELVRAAINDEDTKVQNILEGRYIYCTLIMYSDSFNCKSSSSRYLF